MRNRLGILGHTSLPPEGGIGPISQREILDSPIALIDKAELAQALGVSTWTLDDWLRKGKLIQPIPLAGNVHRWRVRDIEKWLKQMETRSHAPAALRGKCAVQLMAQLADEAPPPPKRERVRLTDPDEAVEEVWR